MFYIDDAVCPISSSIVGYVKRIIGVFYEVEFFSDTPWVFSTHFREKELKLVEEGK